MISALGSFYHVFFYQPILNLVLFLYETVAFEDLGVAIIFMTIIIRIILYPVFAKSAQHSAMIQKIQPHMKKVQDAHKNDKVKQSEEMMKLYREHKVNPFAGILLLILQLPVLIALFQVSNGILSAETLQYVYSFLPQPDSLHHSFLGLIDLTKSSTVLVAVAALLQYLQGKAALPKTEAKEAVVTPAEKMGRQMVVIAPLFTFFVLLTLPAAIGLYVVASTTFSLLQQVHINKKLKKKEHGEPEDFHKKAY